MKTGLVKTDGSPIMRADVQRARMSATAFEFGRSNEGAGHNNPFTANWFAGLRSADADIFRDRDMLVARTRDQVRNDPVASSALHRRVNSAVGFAWRLSSRINWRALGITEDQAQELRKDINVAFQHYAYGPTFQSDAEHKRTFGQNLRMGAAHIGQDGEALAAIEWAPEERLTFNTRLRLIDPDRLSNPNGAPDSVTLRRGVELGTPSFEPVAYHIREAHPSDIAGIGMGNMRWRRWTRYSTPWRRPQILHAYDAFRAGQTRGVSRFVSALKQFRALSKFTDATLQTATINALLVGFIKSNAGFNAVGESFGVDDLKSFFKSRDAFWGDNSINLADAKLPVLPPGDEVELATASRDTTGFDSFVRAMLRLIAAALGITYEELSMDFSQTNYSSARAAMVIAWAETMALRGLLEAQIATPFYMAWLEEAIDNGAVKIPAAAPDFQDAMDAWSECKWIGPARGYIDQTKEIDAAAARIESGISSLQKECEEQGEDWEEIAQQNAFARRRYQELGIPYPGDDGARARVADMARDPNHNAALEQRQNP